MANSVNEPDLKYFTTPHSKISKDRLLNALEGFPDEFSIDELVELLVLMKKVDKGIEQDGRGETFTMDQMKQKFEKWLK